MTAYALLNPNITDALYQSDTLSLTGTQQHNSTCNIKEASDLCTKAIDQTHELINKRQNAE